MPSCRITNYTTQPLNVCLKHIAAIHFENEVAPGATVKLKPGRVWFTLEVLVDDKDNRYSVASSAAAIAIVSLACVGTAALAVPAVAAAGTAGTIGAVGSTLTTVGSTIVGTASHLTTTIGATIAGSSTTMTTAIATSGAAIVSGGEGVVAGLGSIVSTAQGFVLAHAEIVGKISAALLPKAIQVVEEEVGGFNNVQKEVISILSSPNVATEVRESGLSILSRLGVAVAKDRMEEDERRKKEGDGQEKVQERPVEGHRRMGSVFKKRQEPTKDKDTGSSASSTDGQGHDEERPSLKRVQTSVSTLKHKLSERKEAKQAKQETRRKEKEERKDAEWQVCDFDPSCMLNGTSNIRIHGLFMNERRHFEVHERDGKLVLMDSKTGEVVKT